MKMLLFKILIAFSIIVFIIGCEKGIEQFMSVPNAHSIVLLKALVSESNTFIHPENLNCEINGSKLNGELNDVSIGDIIGDYLLSSHTKINILSRFHSSISCSNEKILKCTWNYGVKKLVGGESWNTTIKFEFDPLSQKILTDSLQCIQIP